MFHDEPKEFPGVQMQIAVKSVQATDFSYFHCMLVARPEFGGLAVNLLGAPPDDVLVEPKREDVAAALRSGQDTGMEVTD